MFKRLFKNIYYLNVNTNPIKKQTPSNFSYGNFLLKNPTANKVERRNAIKKFLDSTRNTNSQK